jgi:multimeric flavodoxin WrbA
MKAIAFNGSPRKNGNTQTLVEAVLKGAAGKGAETRLVNLHELDMKGCDGCEACKRGVRKCAQKDDLTPLLQEMRECDAIVLGTPVYCFHVSSQLKALIDRCFCFFDWEPDPETGEVVETCVFPEGKKFVVVTSRADEENPAELAQLYDYLHEWLNVVIAGFRPASTEFIHHYSSMLPSHSKPMANRDTARKDDELMARAESVGAALV